MKFEYGQKVVCVSDDHTRKHFAAPGLPVVGKEYTITGINSHHAFHSGEDIDIIHVLEDTHYFPVDDFEALTVAMGSATDDYDRAMGIL